MTKEINYTGGNFPAEEQETTISIVRAEEGAEVWTSDRTMMTKLDRLCRESPENYKLRETGKDRQGYLLCKTYMIKDKSLISFRSRKVVKDMTEEQREALAEAMRKRRAVELVSE